MLWKLICVLVCHLHQDSALIQDLEPNEILPEFTEFEEDNRFMTREPHNFRRLNNSALEPNIVWKPSLSTAHEPFGWKPIDPMKLRGSYFGRNPATLTKKSPDIPTPVRSIISIKPSRVAWTLILPKPDRSSPQPINWRRLDSAEDQGTDLAATKEKNTEDTEDDGGDSFISSNEDNINEKTSLNSDSTRTNADTTKNTASDTESDNSIDTSKNNRRTYTFTTSTPDDEEIVAQIVAKSETTTIRDETYEVIETTVKVITWQEDYGTHKASTIPEDEADRNENFKQDFRKYRDSTYATTMLEKKSKGTYTYAADTENILDNITYVFEEDISINKQLNNLSTQSYMAEDNEVTDLTRKTMDIHASTRETPLITTEEDKVTKVIIENSDTTIVNIPKVITWQEMYGTSKITLSSIDNDKNVTEDFTIDESLDSTSTIDPHLTRSRPAVKKDDLTTVEDTTTTIETVTPEVYTESTFKIPEPVTITFVHDSENSLTSAATEADTIDAEKVLRFLNDIKKGGEDIMGPKGSSDESLRQLQGLAKLQQMLTGLLSNQTQAQTYTSTTTTETEPPSTIDFSSSKLVAKCYVCGLDVEGVPYTSDCADAFASDFIPLVPMRAKARGMISSFRKYCRYLNTNRVINNEKEPRSVFGRFTGGCSVRWVDLTGIYTQRSCRNRRRAVLGRHYASKRMAKLEMALSEVNNGCIISPMATLLPVARSISLYARFHACVCTGYWCNTAVVKKQWMTNNALMTVLVVLLY